jgi:hydroxyacylglutathione hydrolase
VTPPDAAAQQRGPGVLVAAAMGAWATNGVILGSTRTGQAVIVDPGQHAADPLARTVERLGLVPVAILLTHGHLDHLWSAPELARRHRIPVHLHPDDRWLWERPPAAFGAQGDLIAAGHGFGPWVLDERPLAAQAAVLLAGDLLFAGSIGRTDLAGGDPAEMQRSLALTMARCSDDTLVIPGHGPATSIGAERATNPFLSR